MGLPVFARSLPCHYGCISLDLDVFLIYPHILQKYTLPQSLSQGAFCMMADFATDLTSEVIRIYQEIDQKTAWLQAAGLRCPPGCGTCCESPEVEATVLEALPLAEEIYRRKVEGRVLIAIAEREDQGDLRCVLCRPDLLSPGKGRCSYYEFRSLACRLFGFAARRNKYGHLEFCACRVIKERNPQAVRRVEIKICEGLDVPVYQESFMRIASMDPGMGFPRLPINRALKEALERLYWRKARDSTEVQ